MSNRVLKKVLGEAEEIAKASPESEDEGPSFATVSSNKRPVLVNPYALLNELSESEAKEDDGLAEEDEGGEGAEADDVSQATTKKKKKRKKPKKKKGTAAGGSGSDRALDTEVEEDEAHRQQRQSQKGSSKSGPGTGLSVKSDEGQSLSPVNAKLIEVFKLDPKFINSEFELKKIFGAKVIKYERNKQGQRRIFRHSRLVMPKEEWQLVSSVGTGISMSYLNSLDGFLYFKYSHSDGYREVQKQFLQAVDTLNPDNVVRILRMYPYHIDAHVQLSDMAKAAEDMSVAADLVEGAIHCLENSFHTRFTLTNPLCRLEYKYQENRPFFILLFKHLVFVGQRACYRTALELCKRLLCFDPVSDPLCATLMIDFYALKAGEGEWLVEMYKFYDKQRNLEQLPNFSYSVALAYHLLSVKKSGDAGLSSKADAMIQYAVLMFPSVLLALLDKVGVQVDSRSRNHTYLNSFAQSSQSRSLRLLCELYVWRTHHVWKESTVLAWLERNLTVVLNKVDKKDPIVADYEEKRKRRYQATTPRNILRHILLLDNKDLNINLPPDLSKEPILNFDPLPPTDAVDIYNIKEISLSRNHRPQRHGGLLNLFMQSLWHNDLNMDMDEERLARRFANLQPPVAVPGGGIVIDEPEDQPIALRAGLQQSVTALLDAMRDLLTNAAGRREGDDAAVADGEDSATDGEGAGGPPID